jgi:AcrR family transcriptional regulator
MSATVIDTIMTMVRWEPGAKERLQLAAVALFLARGFEQTTVQDIAQEAGLTERTFFRHFADKREVLFQGQQQYVAEFVRGIREAPEDTSPFALIRASLAGAAGFFDDERRPWSRQRQVVIDGNPALQERESLKRVSLTDALTAALVERGVDGTDARLTAEIGVSAFFVAFREWIAPDEQRAFDQLQQEALGRVAAIVPAAAPA